MQNRPEKCREQWHNGKLSPPVSHLAPLAQGEKSQGVFTGQKSDWSAARSDTSELRDKLEPNSATFLRHPPVSKV